jgi:hypothetical protein
VLVERVVVLPAGSEALAKLGAVAQRLREIGLTPVARGVLRHVNDHHVGRIGDGGRAEPVDRHRRLAGTGRPDEDHAREVEAGQFVHRLAQVRRPLQAERADVLAGVVDDVVALGRLADRDPLGRTHSLSSRDDHLL